MPHATIAQFYVVFVKHFVVFVAGWKVFIEKGKKFFANIFKLEKSGYREKN